MMHLKKDKLINIIWLVLNIIIAGSFTTFLLFHCPVFYTSGKLIKFELLFIIFFLFLAISFCFIKRTTIVLPVKKEKLMFVGIVSTFIFFLMAIFSPYYWNIIRSNQIEICYVKSGNSESNDFVELLEFSDAQNGIPATIKGISNISLPIKIYQNTCISGYFLSIIENEESLHGYNIKLGNESLPGTLTVTLNNCVSKFETFSTEKSQLLVTNGEIHGNIIEWPWKTKWLFLVKAFCLFVVSLVLGWMFYSPISFVVMKSDEPPFAHKGKLG